MSTAQSLQQVGVESKTVMICPCCGGEGLVPNGNSPYGDDPLDECAVCQGAGYIGFSFGQAWINWRRNAPNAHLLGGVGWCEGENCERHGWLRLWPDGELLCAKCDAKRCEAEDGE